MDVECLGFGRGDGRVEGKANELCPLTWAARAEEL